MAVLVLQACVMETSPVHEEDPFHSLEGDGKADESGARDAGDAISALGRDWSVVFVPPQDGSPAYVFPEDLEDGTTWKARFNLRYVSKADEYVVVEGPHFVFEPSTWTQQVIVALQDPFGVDQQFDMHYWTPARFWENPRERFWPLVSNVYHVDIRPLPDRMITRRHDHGEADQRFRSGWFDPDKDQARVRYFVSPFPLRTFPFSSLSGEHEVTIRVTCGGETCGHQRDRDTASLTDLPSFCRGRHDEERPGAAAICSPIVSSRSSSR